MSRWSRVSAEFTSTWDDGDDWRPGKDATARRLEIERGSCAAEQRRAREACDRLRNQNADAAGTGGAPVENAEGPSGSTGYSSQSHKRGRGRFGSKREITVRSSSGERTQFIKPSSPPLSAIVAASMLQATQGSGPGAIMVTAVGVVGTVFCYFTVNLALRATLSHIRQ